MHTWRFVEILEMRIAPAATTFIWDGPAGGSWMNPVNWVGDIAPTPGSALVFPAPDPPAFGTKITNDFPVGTEFDSLTFTGDGQEGYWVQGNGIALNAGIRTTGTAGGLVGLPLKLTGDQTFFSDSRLEVLSTNTLFSGEQPMVRDFNGHTLTLAGSGDVQFAGEFIDTSGIGESRLIHTGAGIAHIDGRGNGVPEEVTASSGTTYLGFHLPNTHITLDGGLLQWVSNGNSHLGGLTTNAGLLHRVPQHSAMIVDSDLTMKQQSTLIFDVVPDPEFGQAFSEIKVSGSVDLGNASLIVNLYPQPLNGRQFVLINNEGTDPVSGTFAGLPEGALLRPAGNPYSGFAPGSNVQFRISYQGGDGNDVVLTTVVPEVQISVDRHIATFTDVDGDLVTVKTKLGQFDPRQFRLVPSGELGGFRLALLDIRSIGLLDGIVFSNTNLKITAAPGPQGGDGLANVGALDADEFHSFNRVIIGGDLGRALFGNATLFSVNSLGALGTSTQLEGPFTSLDTVVKTIGKLKVQTDVRDANVSAESIQRVAVQGSLIGGEAPSSGSIQAGKVITSIKVGGDIVGGSGVDSGSIIGGTWGGARHARGLGTVFVGGSLIGGTADGAGSIRAVSNPIQNVTIGGSITSEIDQDFDRDASIIAGTAIGSIRIFGDISARVTNPVVIAAVGQAGPPAAGFDWAIGSLEVGGSVKHARILAGYDFSTHVNSDSVEPGVNADASIGTITVGGNWIASTVLAGVGAGSDGYDGTRDDAELRGAQVRDNPQIFSEIAAIVIRGQANGSAREGDTFGIVAEQLGAAQIGQTIFHFKPEVGDARDFYFLGSTAPGPIGGLTDVAMHEANG
jgi:hypothetical protein